MDFDAEDALDQLERLNEAALDGLAFGVVGLAADGTTTRYNRTEATLAGLDPELVLGRSFFVEVAPCMNNFMVAQRMLDEPEIDEVVPYVLTVRMKPTPVRLRLLKRAGGDAMYLLIDRT